MHWQCQTSCPSTGCFTILRPAAWTF